MEKVIKGRFYSACDLGRVRNINQDRVLALRNEFDEILLLVADGIGGLSNGEEASEKVRSTYSAEFKIKKKKSIFGNKKWLIRVAKKINKELFLARENSDGVSDCGTTLTVALLAKNRLIVLNVGDSRCYWVKEDKLVQITEDQTVASYLEKTGKEEEIENNPEVRHGLTNAVGIYPSLAVDCFIHKYRGEKILLCTDGLYNDLKEVEIEAILKSNENINEKVNMLIAEANGNGGNDNIGIVYWESF